MTKPKTARLPLNWFHPCTFLAVVGLALATRAPAQPAGTELRNNATQKASEWPRRAPAPQACAACIRAHMEFLASDALRGRGSGTSDELVAATYIAAQLRQYGIRPAGDDGGYLQRAAIRRRKLTGSPQLRFTPPGEGVPAPEVTWNHGQEMLVLYLSQAEFSGPLRKIDLEAGAPAAQAGEVVLLTGKNADQLQGLAFRLLSHDGAAAVLLAETPRSRAHWQETGSQIPEIPNQLEGPQSPPGGRFNLLALSHNAVATLGKLPNGTQVRFAAPSAPPEKAYTWNVVGMLRGSTPALRRGAILFSAHLDHLGTGPPVKGDDIYNGADDDASGTTAVLELARVLGAGPRPRRTVVFAWFGSEEAGGLGSTYFREHPPVQLNEIAANLEFEMIGRADPAVAPHTLWLTGWERSNLGPELAAHGAHLVGDPHPDQHFFNRSDNYVLAKKGVVAQTVSSYGLHPDYHQPSDDVAHIDFAHMQDAIGSLLQPVQWLVNNGFRPQWTKGGQP